MIELNLENIDSLYITSDLHYLHTFAGLDSVHCQMEETKLTEVMKNIGYRITKTATDVLPNGKSLVRLDYEVAV